MSAIIPIPRTPITIRPGVMSDLPFIDSLQKLHTKQVGWMPTATLEGKIKLGHVIVAEERREMRGERRDAEGASSLTSPLSSLVPVGYCIGNDQYFKRDDVGIIYQMNVVPDRQRGLIGATLVKAMFDRAAYGCKLFCCWCAQDIEANHFWESLGFVPLAFRAGSRDRGPKGGGRVHIFWQRRIRTGDTTTPYWFPSQTTSGSIREDRIVLPIPPGTHWRDAKPIILPGTGSDAGNDEPKQLPKPRQKKPTAPVIERTNIVSGGLRLTPPKPAEPEPKPKREPRQKVKNDPKYVAAARELRDRWLEKVNDDPSLLDSHGKYDVSRTLSAVEGSKAFAAPSVEVVPRMPSLPAPIAA